MKEKNNQKRKKRVNDVKEKKKCKNRSKMGKRKKILK